MPRRKKRKGSPAKIYKNKGEVYTHNPLDTSLPVRGESELQFDSLPKKIKEVEKLSPTVIQDKESLAFVELQQVKYYIEQFGDDVPRIAKLVGVTNQRAKKLIDDVYNIVWGIEGRSNAEQRRRHKKRHMSLLDRLVENGLDYIEDGYKSRQLSPSEFKLIAGEVRSALNDKAKMHGIGNTVIFEQFNQQTNINLSPAQMGIEKDKDMRFLLDKLQERLTQDDDGGILDVEILE